MVGTITIIDYGKLFTGTEQERRQSVKTMTEGFKRYGFVKFVNHGIPDDTISELFGWIKKFYRLPLSAKQRAANIPSANPQRGWSGIGGETTASLYGKNGTKPTGTLRDEKEHYDIGPECDLDFPNRWPDESDVPGWRSFMESYYELAQRVSLEVLAALEIGLELPQGAFVSRCSPAASELRLLYYPEVKVKELQAGDTMRIWPHTDFGLLSLLIQDSVGGLEVEDPQNPGTYIAIPPSEARSELIVNSSACFERWTNGVIPAATHRLVVPWDHQDDAEHVLQERWSCVHFLKAERLAMVGPMPWFVNVNRPAMFDEINALQFQQRRTELLYSK